MSRSSEVKWGQKTSYELSKPYNLTVRARNGIFSRPFYLRRGKLYLFSSSPALSQPPSRIWGPSRVPIISQCTFSWNFTYRLAFRCAIKWIKTWPRLRDGTRNSGEVRNLFPEGAEVLTKTFWFWTIKVAISGYSDFGETRQNFFCSQSNIFLLPTRIHEEKNCLINLSRSSEVKWAENILWTL